MRLSFLSIPAIIAVAVLLPAPVAAAAPPVACGDTISANVRLSTDLICEGPVGLSLSPGVTLDLGGHTLKGAGRESGTAISVLTGDGTVLDLPIAVRNGSLAAWTTGVDSYSGGGTVDFRKMRVTDVTTALGGIGITYNVRDSRFTDNDSGVLVLFGSVSVLRSTFVRNRQAVTLAGSGTLTVSGSVFRDNAEAVGCSEVILNVSRSTFLRNERAISGWWCEGAKIADNNFTANGVAYHDEWGPGDGRDELRGNRFVGNDTAVSTQVSVYLRSNTFFGNDTGLRAVDYPEPLFAEVVELDRNKFRGNGDAVYIEIDARIRSTSAIGNRGYGIYAPRAIDLGGNIARGNGIEPQCTGVVCRTR